MITPADSYNTFDLGKYYAILQQSNEISQNEYKSYFKSLNLNFDQMRMGTSYNSKDNSSFSLGDVDNFTIGFKTTIDCTM